jgi:hypothetical protein
MNSSEKYEEAAPQEFPAPIGKLLGLMLIRNGPRRATVEFNADERYGNPMGTLHGGVLCDGLRDQNTFELGYVFRLACETSSRKSWRAAIRTVHVGVLET